MTFQSIKDSHRGLSLAELTGSSLKVIAACLGDGKRGVRIFFNNSFSKTKNILWIVLPDFIVSYNRHADSLSNSLLIPGLTDALAKNILNFHVCGHLRWRSLLKQYFSAVSYTHLTLPTKA